MCVQPGGSHRPYSSEDDLIVSPGEIYDRTPRLAPRSRSFPDDNRFPRASWLRHSLAGPELIVRLRSKKLQKGLTRSLGLVGHKDVTGVRKLDQLRARNLAGKEIGVGCRHEAI